MRFSDATKPAMSWEEAAMSPARPRTLSGGAALRTLIAKEEARQARALEDGANAAAKDAGNAEDDANRSAADLTRGGASAQQQPAAAPVSVSVVSGLPAAALRQVMRSVRRLGRMG